jgi:hypothetical protein
MIYPLAFPSCSSCPVSSNTDRKRPALHVSSSDTTQVIVAVVLLSYQCAPALSLQYTSYVSARCMSHSCCIVSRIAPVCTLPSHRNAIMPFNWHYILFQQYKCQQEVLLLRTNLNTAEVTPSQSPDPNMLQWNADIHVSSCSHNTSGRNSIASDGRDRIQRPNLLTFINHHRNTT